MKNLIFSIAFLFTGIVFSQFSKVHFIPPVSSSDALVVNDQYIYISSPSITDVDFTVKFPNGDIAFSGKVSRDFPFVYRIGSGNNTQIIINKTDVGKIMTNKGYIIEAKDLVYACLRFTAGQGNDSNQAGSIVSKGLAAPGKLFRVGAFTNKDVASVEARNYTFATILALENNTEILFSDIKSGVILVNNAAVSNNLPSIILNQGESYAFAAQGPNSVNRDPLIGALISANKKIVVNCGSFGGTNGDLRNLDLGMDQIVAADKIGQEYIFIKGKGQNVVERPLIVAHENGTDVYINDDPTPIITNLDGGKYIAIDGSKYTSNGNMYVRTTKKVFAYQGLGGTVEQANQNMHFVPPINCATPKKIDNIPFINQIGSNNDFTGTVSIFTNVGAIINFVINGINYSLADLPSTINKIGPKAVVGNPIFETYTFSGLTGNVSVLADKSLYLSYYGSSGFATYGGFYSGFTFDPEILYNNLDVEKVNCLPFVALKVNVISAFDNLQWFKNGIAIAGANDFSFVPDAPGYYFVQGTINACGSAQNYISVEIPVSICSPDSDNDTVNDNIDLDLDNDAIANCQESFGDIKINTVTANLGNINYLTDYSNSFSGLITKKPAGSAATFLGNNDNFVMQVPAGKDKSLRYDMVFAKPISIALLYSSNAAAPNLLNSKANFKVTCDINKTITVSNNDNQLLIDTDYDGFYETGIKSFSSFDIRFRLNSTVPLAAGSGTFSFRSHLAKTFSITQENLSETDSNSATFTLIATCIPKDNDQDGTIDQLDLDTDNDGILDYTEYFGHYPVQVYNTLTDNNDNGIKDTFETLNDFPWDTDADGVKNYLDLDSDNDGIFDLFEATNSNNNGIIVGNQASFGTNGLSNAIETAPDNGILTYLYLNSDDDSLPNFIDADSDNDGCNDVIEAGFVDQNNDGYLGNTNPNVDKNGKVIFAIGYTIPAVNYIKRGLINIIKEPINLKECNLQTGFFEIQTNTLVANILNPYQWQVSTNNGVSYSNIFDNANYSGTNTQKLTLTEIPATFNNYKYRVFLNTDGNSCGDYSQEVDLVVNQVPVLVSNLTLKQCDIDADGQTDVNLNEKNSFISANYLNEDFYFYTDQNDAKTKNSASQITTTNVYTSTSKTIYVRVENKITKCFSTAILNLVVSIPPPIFASYFPEIKVCDDFLDKFGDNTIANNDKDGTSSFDINPIKTEILAKITNSNNYNVKFYKSVSDALLENIAGNSLEISNITSYRNALSPNLQIIYARAENIVNNDCFGIVPIKLIVEKLPDITTTDNAVICKNAGNNAVKLTAGIQDNSSIALYNYLWTKDNIVLQDEKNVTLEIGLAGIYTVKVTNKLTTCFRIRTITVIESDVAQFLEPIVVDVVQDNSVIINTFGTGIYEFAIDNKNGVYQTSNTFTNITFGQHEFFVRDTNNCGIVSQIVNVTGAPQFFTPNGDGYNDFWNLKGIDAKNSFSKVQIYDRFGKLLKQFAVNSQGWDGKLNDQMLPSDDYWYIVELQDGRIVKGHLSLKR